MMTVLAHSPEHYRRLGRIVAGAGTTPMPDLVTAYGEGLMDVLAIRCCSTRPPRRRAAAPRRIPALGGLFEAPP
jgi:uncharacterized protein YbgA (DUF1722 family)